MTARIGSGWGRAFLGRLGPLALGLVLALGAAEAVLRVSGDRLDGYYVWWPYLRKIFHPEPGVMAGIEGEKLFATNSLGLRGDEPSTDDTFRVLALGGSTTECLFLDQDEAWPQRLQTLLNERQPAERVWVANGAKSGLNTRDHVAQLRHLLPRLAPIDLVVLLLGVNDLQLPLGEGDAYDPGFLDRPDGDDLSLRRAFARLPAAREQRRFPRNLALWNVAGRMRDRLFPSERVQDADGQVYVRWRGYRRDASRVLPTLPDLDAALGEYRANLQSLIDVCAESRARVLLLTQPSLWRADLTPAEEASLWLGGVGDFMQGPGCQYYATTALAEGMARYNAALIAVAGENGAGVLDLAERVPRDLEHFYDDVHFNEGGAELVAEVVARHLLERGLRPE